MALADVVGLFETLSLNGSYRGIGFAFVDGSDEAGRRILAFLSPGQDVTRFQDLGQLDGDIVFTGILIGDDYAHQAARMRAAFQTPGPATLVTPWWGTIEVLQSPGKPPKFNFAAEKLRVATFTATVRITTPNQPPATDTLQGLLDDLADMRTAALGMLTSVLAPAALTLSTIGAVESMAGELASTLGGLILAVSYPLVGIAGGLPIGLLSGVGSIAPDTRYGTNVAALLAAPSAAIAATTTPAIPAAVAPGGVTTTAAPVDGRVTAGLLLTTAATLAPAPGAAALPGLAIATSAFLLADAMQAASDIVYDSQQEAAAWRDRVAAALDAAATLAAAQVQANATAATTLWRALVAARAAWLADMSVTVGRLPPVVTFTPPAQVPVWLLAYYLYGDDPSHMLPGYLDIVARNGIRHPAMPPPGPLEILA